MKFRKYCSIILVILTSIKLSGQPGYLGQKTSIGFQYECSPYDHRFSPVFETGFVDENFFRIVRGYHLSYARVLNRRFEAIAGVGARFRNYMGQYIEVKTYNSSGYLESADESYKTNEYHIDLGIRRYFKGKVAPLGWYQQITCGWLTARYKDDADFIPIRYSRQNNATLHNAPVTTREISSMRCSYGIGFKRMINNTIFFMSEFDINILLKRFDFYYYGLSVSNINSSNYQKYNFEQNFNVFGRYNLYFGIGILLR
jgi:hypothetical protein